MKLNHILFPVDFSDRTQLLTPQVEWMANHFECKVTLLHIFEIPAAWYGNADGPVVNMEFSRAFCDAATRNLNRYSISLPENRVQRVIAEGDAAFHITSWAKNNGVDLIMMGTHGYGRIRGLLLGSVTAKVIHDTDCAVWTDSLLHSHPDRKKRKLRTILCAVDKDGETIPLLLFAAQLAKEFSAEVQVIHAVPEAESRPDKYLDFDLHQYLVDSARVELSKLQRAAGTDFRVRISTQAISKAVAETALQKDCDLVLIGRGKAQEGLGRLRTHAYQIIRDAPVAVLSYPAHRQDHTSSSCSEEHLSQSEACEPLLIDCPRP